MILNPVNMANRVTEKKRKILRWRRKNDALSEKWSRLMLECETRRKSNS